MSNLGPLCWFQAMAAQKFRLQQEQERRAHLEQLRSREQDKLSQVTERRKAIETADKERKEALLKKAEEREEKILEKRKASASQIAYAFGSSTPRTLHPRTDSTNDVWGAAAKRSAGCTSLFIPEGVS